jgi:hypothetical protein
MFIKKVIQDHYFPLLDQRFKDIFRVIYPGGIRFFVDNWLVGVPSLDVIGQRNNFVVTIGRRRKPVGLGFLGKSDEPLPENMIGLAISTFGKVIKRGWDWVGISLKNPMTVSGLVEIPDLVEILTTNKADFLRDTTSLQKYYKYRKAVQDALAPILRKLGEITPPRERTKRDYQSIEKEIERVLSDMLDDFPELGPLFGRRSRAEHVTGIIQDPEQEEVGVPAEGVDVITGNRGGSGEGSGVEVSPGTMVGTGVVEGPSPTEPGHIHIGRRRRPGILLAETDAEPDREELGWLHENTIWINSLHPAYKKTEDRDYHAILTVAWVLSGHLESGKPQQDFINRFLKLWGSRS